MRCRGYYHQERYWKAENNASFAEMFAINFLTLFFINLDSEMTILANDKSFLTSNLNEGDLISFKIFEVK